MTATYTPFATDKDRVRFWIGDTDTSAPIYTDETIDALILEAGSWQGAAVMAVQGIIATLAGTVNYTADWLKVDASSKLAHYRALLAELQSQFNTNPITTTFTVPTRYDGSNTDD